MTTKFIFVYICFVTSDTTFNSFEFLFILENDTDEVLIKRSQKAIDKISACVFLIINENNLKK